VTPTNQDEAVEHGITKFTARILSLVIPALLTVIGFFVLRVFSTVEGIAADNQRFNTYVITNNQRMENLEDRVKKVEQGTTQASQEVMALDKKQSDAWAEFWKDYGFMLNPNRPHAKPLR